MSIISIGKLLLFLCALVYIPVYLYRTGDQSQQALRTPQWVLAALLGLAISVTWSTAPLDEGLVSLAKYGKLLIIPVLVLLIRNRQEAAYALIAFFAGQLFQLISSWMLFFHLPVPWATSRLRLSHYSVFSTYLDQGIMMAVLAFLLWSFRSKVRGRWAKAFVIGLACLAVLNVFLILEGRTGQLVAITLLFLVCIWEIPRRYRLAAVFVPIIFATALVLGSERVRDRFQKVQAEIQSYSVAEKPIVLPENSSGARLHLWRRAAQAIAEKPALGSGVGSWASEYNRLETKENPSTPQLISGGNPHQEYLFWTIQLGIVGLLLLFGLMLSVLRDARQLPREYAQAVQLTLVALGVACLFNSSIYDALIGDFFCVALGLFLAAGIRNKTIPHIQPENRL